VPTSRLPPAGLAVAVALAVLTLQCARLEPPRWAPSRPARLFSVTAMVDGKPLDLHFAKSQDPANQVLVLYASGDGGWFGAAVGMFHSIAAMGFDTVGFSSKALLRVERVHGQPTRLGRVARGYRQVIDQARKALDLPPSSRVVLCGWSSGAALAVLVGSRSAAVEADRVAGVVAIGLPGVQNLDDDDADDDGPSENDVVPTRGRTYNNYGRLRLMESVPSVVIQATGDAYLPADAARTRLGPDTGSRRLITVQATSHKFTGGEEAFQAALRTALDWVTVDRVK
jgi:dienelactone hydrolase